MDRSWRKSSYSKAGLDNCVEARVADALLTWHKASYSGNEGACVEVAELPEAVLVRDTQHREHGHLGFPGAAWTSFLQDVKADRL